MWIDPLYDSSSLLGIIPILLCICFANLSGTMIPSSHHPMKLWLNINKQDTWNHLPHHHCFDPHDIPSLDGYQTKIVIVWDSPSRSSFWPSDCRWQAYFINAKGWKRWSTNTSRAIDGHLLTLVDVEWCGFPTLRAKILRFPPKTSPDMLVHHSDPFGNTTTCLSNFSTPKRSTNFDGNTPSAIGIGRVCLVMFRFETIRNRCDSNMLSRKHLVYLLGRFYQATTSTHQRHRFRLVAPSPRDRGGRGGRGWRLFLLQIPPLEIPLASHQEETIPFLTEKWRSNGSQKNTLNMGIWRIP